jgi:hypothetical protein
MAAEGPMADTRAPGKELTISENLSALGVSTALLVGGLVLAESSLGTVANTVGGIMTVIGGITWNMMLWGLLKSLWRGPGKK